MEYVNCKQYASEILEAVARKPDKKSLTVISVGNNPASESYVRGKLKDCAECGISCNHVRIVEGCATHLELPRAIYDANNDDHVGGVIVQLPLPGGMREEIYTNAVRADKDVDGFRPDSPFTPCTPEGILYVLHQELGELEGKHAVVVGRGKLVGAPIAELLLKENCTVTVAHSKTRHLEDICGMADIVIVAVGQPNAVNLEWCHEAGIVIDCGVNRDENGKLCGDCYNFIPDQYDWIKVTPVPGGIGLMTRAVLMAHVAGLEVDAK